MFYSVKSVGHLTISHIFRIAYLDVLGLYGHSTSSWEEKTIIESFAVTALLDHPFLQKLSNLLFALGWQPDEWELFLTRSLLML